MNIAENMFKEYGLQLKLWKEQEEQFQQQNDQFNPDCWHNTFNPPFNVQRVPISLDPIIIQAGNIVDDDFNIIHIPNNDGPIDIVWSDSEDSKESSTGAAFYDDGPTNTDHHISLTLRIFK